MRSNIEYLRGDNIVRCRSTSSALTPCSGRLVRATTAKFHAVMGLSPGMVPRREENSQRSTER